MRRILLLCTVVNARPVQSLAVHHIVPNASDAALYDELSQPQVVSPPFHVVYAALAETNAAAETVSDAAYTVANAADTVGDAARDVANASMNAGVIIENIEADMRLATSRFVRTSALLVAESQELVRSIESVRQAAQWAFLMSSALFLLTLYTWKYDTQDSPPRDLLRLRVTRKSSRERCESNRELPRATACLASKLSSP